MTPSQSGQCACEDASFFFIVTLQTLQATSNNASERAQRAECKSSCPAGTRAAQRVHFDSPAASAAIIWAAVSIGPAAAIKSCLGIRPTALIIILTLFLPEGVVEEEVWGGGRGDRIDDADNTAPVTLRVGDCITVSTGFVIVVVVVVVVDVVDDDEGTSRARAAFALFSRSARIVAGDCGGIADVAVFGNAAVIAAATVVTRPPSDSR